MCGALGALTVDLLTADLLLEASGGAAFCAFEAVGVGVAGAVLVLSGAGDAAMTTIGTTSVLGGIAGEVLDPDLAARFGIGGRLRRTGIGGLLAAGLLVTGLLAAGLLVSGLLVSGLLSVFFGGGEATALAVTPVEAVDALILADADPTRAIGRDARSVVEVGL